MTIRKTALIAMTLAVLGTAACTATGTANLQFPNSQPIAATSQVKEAYITADSSTTVRDAIQAPDYYSYRAQSDTTNVNVWVIYYYAPSTGKSYRCNTDASTKQVISINEVSGAEAYKPDYQIDKSKVKVSNDEAKTNAVTIINNTTVNNTNVNVDVNVNQNVTVNNIQNIQLISPKECKDQTGQDSSAPVWLVVTQNTKVYVNAETKATIATVPNTGSGATSPMPSMSPSTMPSASTSPSAMPTASMSPAATTSPTTSPSASASASTTVTM